ncbi:unnamed protein product [Leuciscus chuanchicus]
MCVWGICPLTTDQFPVPGGFNLLLYPVSVPGPFGPHTLLIPVTTAERNTQHTHTPQANRDKITSQSLSKPSNANGAFLQPEPGPAPNPAPNSGQGHALNPTLNAGRGPTPNPALNSGQGHALNPTPNTAHGPTPNTGPNPAHDSAPGPAPDLHTLPSESPALQGQQFIVINIKNIKGFSCRSRAFMCFGGVALEGAQKGGGGVVLLLPVRVDSPSMGVMEASAPVPDPAPDPDPGHLQVPLSTSTSPTAHTHGDTAAHTHTLRSIRTPDLSLSLI